jgi:hypothetical protein
VLPGRLGVRFALEALFLLLLAVGAGLADLRPALIVLVMAIAWVIVALIEFTAERIARSSISYLLPTPQAGEDEPQRIFWPRPEERTVVAPPAEQPAAEEPAARSTPEAQETPEPEPEQEEVAQPEPEVEEPGLQAPPRRRRMRSLLRRRERELDSTPHAPPRHVKLLPRRAAPEPSRATREVAELFGSGDDDETGTRESGG